MECMYSIEYAGLIYNVEVNLQYSLPEVFGDPTRITGIQRRMEAQGNDPMFGATFSFGVYTNSGGNS